MLERTTEITKRALDLSERIPFKVKPHSFISGTALCCSDCPRDEDVSFGNQLFVTSETGRKTVQYIRYTIAYPHLIVHPDHRLSIVEYKPREA